jgi:hypothetical protein
MSLRSITRVAARGSAPAMTLLLFAVTPALAVTCDPSFFPAANTTYYPNRYTLGELVTTWRFNQQATNWAGVGVLAFDTNSDYDITMYGECYGPLLANSAYGVGRTDFVIGDYNNNPTGYDAIDVHCYSGQCMGTSQYGAAAWRDGDQMFVDFPPVTLNFNSGPPYSSDMVFHVWDVFLSAGTTYSFQFSSTLGNAGKLCLFRNPSQGGTYWAGRSSAVWETSGCTTYTAPASGYYGLVMVNDVWALGSATVGVFTTLQCACADSLAPLSPFAVTAPPGIAYKWVHHDNLSWAAVGVRPQAGSDWDLEVDHGDTAPGCPQSVLATSSFGGSVADFVMVDFNHVSGPNRFPFAIKPYHYSGGGSGSLEADYDAGRVLIVNGPQEVQVWNANQVLACWDVLLNQGVTYTFQFAASGNMRALLFRNPGSGLYAAGRNAAEAQSTTTFDYTAAATGWYGIVVVKDDDQTGWFGLRVGRCTTPFALTANTPAGVNGAYGYLTINPGAGAWQAVGTRCVASADWDLYQYGSTSSAPWPDCYAPPGAVSSSSSVPDFIVGDFRANAPGNYPFMAHQYTSGPIQGAIGEWTGPAVPLMVNAPAVVAAPSEFEVLRIYETPLIGGVAYSIGYAQTATRPLLVFGNPSGSPYWAGRGSALLSTLATTSFTPAASGVYGFVIANDAADTSTFSLRISTNPTGVGDTPRFVTAFTSAYPNPGRGDVELEYSLGAPANVRLELVDVAGRRVWESDVGALGAGAWNAHVVRAGAAGRIPSGLYFAHLVVDGRLIETRKVTLLD